MSGTSYGACVLHVAPESHVGGPLALVQTGDLITLDVPARVLRWMFRTASWRPPGQPGARPRPGYGAATAPCTASTSPRRRGLRLRLSRQARRQPRPRPAVGCRRDEHADRPSERRLPGTREIHAAALRALPPRSRGYLESGAGTEQTLRANREAFTRWVIKPKPMSGVNDPKTNTEVLGIPLSLPVLTAPFGGDALFASRRPPGGGPRQRRVRHRLDRAGGRQLLLRGGRRRRPRRRRGSRSCTRTSPSTASRSGSMPRATTRCASRSTARSWASGSGTGWTASAPTPASGPATSSDDGEPERRVDLRRRDRPRLDLGPARRGDRPPRAAVDRQGHPHPRGRRGRDRRGRVRDPGLQPRRPPGRPGPRQPRRAARDRRRRSRAGSRSCSTAASAPAPTSSSPSPSARAPWSSAASPPTASPPQASTASAAPWSCSPRSSAP